MPGTRSKKADPKAAGRRRTSVTRPPQAKKPDPKAAGRRHTVTRAQRVMAECNRVIARASDEQQLLQDMCRIAIDFGGYRMAWVGLARHDEGSTIAPVASAGDEVNYLASARISWADNEFGRGPAGLAVRTGKPQIVRDLRASPKFKRLRDLVLTRGHRAAAAFPLMFEGEKFGMFGIFAGEPRAFDADEVGLLEGLANDIAYGIYSLRARTARQRAEQALSESEQHYRSISKLFADSYWEQDEQHRFTLVTPSSSDKLVMAQQSWLGKTRWELPYLDMTEEIWRAHRETLERREPFRDFVLKALNAEGKLVYISISGHPVFDSQGNFKGYRGIARNVTESKRAEQLLKLEHTVTLCLAEADSVPAALKAVLRAMCEAENWAYCQYWPVDEKAGVLRFGEYWAAPGSAFERFCEKSRDVVFAPGIGLPGQVWQSGQPLWVTDVTRDPRMLHAALAREAGVHSIFLFPVSSEEKTIGVFSLSSLEMREPDERLQQTLRVISSQIGQFLRRKQAEEILRESEERFRSLTGVSSDWYWEQDEDLRFVEMTHEIVKKTGVSAANHIGKRRWEMPAPNMTEADWAAHRAVVEAHQPFHDLELCRIAHDGKLSYVSISGEPIYDKSGAFKGYRGIGKDITERKRAEQLQALEHAVNRHIADADDVSSALKGVIRAVCESEGWECGRYFRTDEKAGVLRFGEAWGVSDEAVERYIAGSRNITYSPGVGMMGRAWQSGQALWVPDLYNDTRGSQPALTRDAGMHGAFVFPVTSEGKTIGAFAFNSREIRDPDEPLMQAIHVIGSQIGQFMRRKQAEEVLRESEARFRSLTELSSDYYWETDTEHRFTMRGSGGKTDSVFAPGTQIGKRRWELPYTTPDEEGWRAHRATLDTHQPFRDFEFSRLDPNGSRRHFSVSGEPIFDDQGRFSGYRGIGRDITERKSSEEQLAYLAQYDALTGLPNRHMLHDRLTQALVQAQRFITPLGCMFIDLDHFKNVNDTFGHSTGDKLLSQVAARLRECVRSADTVGRLGGDEFAVVLSSLAKAEDAGLVAQKAIDALSKSFDLDGRETYISASIGISIYPADGSEADALLKNADVAMYRAKELGRNNYQYYLPQMNERASQRLQLATSLRGALERNEFLLHYQPKADLATGAISGLEALLRWQHPERGLIPPVEFIPALEETGLIVPVGEWVLLTACEQIKAWQSQGIKPRPVSVNVSARQFQMKNLDKVVAGILQKTGIDPALIELELTESLLMKDAEEAVPVLARLKASGVRLSMDDFGTGYSSLAYLKRFPLDELKIDRAFIRDLTTDPNDAAITLAIISLAHSLNLKVVAEGVETEAQLAFLRSNNCDEMQGFYFARPLQIEDCTRALIENRRLQLPDVNLSNAPTLLIVDDNKNDLELMRQALASGGYNVLTADSGQAALDTLAKQPISVIVSDHNMPDMTGVKFLARVRKLYPQTVRIVMSGDRNANIVTDAINEAGIHKYLSKDWDAVRLRSEVREACRLHKE